MERASLSARIADLIGEDPEDVVRPRPEVAVLAKTLQPGQVAAARDGSSEVAVARSRAGRLYVVADRCPHDGGPLSDGFVDGESIVCARHGWEFALETGESPGRMRARIDCRQVPCPRRQDRDS